MSRFEHFVEGHEELQRRLDRDAELTETTPPPGDAYMALPAAIRMHYTRAEWLWLSDADKAALVQRECEPDY